jgi:ankyrin only family protein
MERENVNHLCQQQNTSKGETNKKKHFAACSDILEYVDRMTFDIDAVDIYSQDKDGDTLLHTAIILPITMYIQLFISKAPGRKWLSLNNLLFQTPLHLAAITNQPEVVRQLIVAGAEVESRDREGNTALHIACREGFHQVVQCLLRPVSESHHNCLRITNIPQDLSIRNYDGVTVLHLAESNQHYDIINDLIASGINVNMKEGKAGRTVLHNACQNGDITLVKLLLKQRNCDINARAYDGSTPFDLARARDRDMICVTLAAAGAKYGDDNSDSDE